MICQNSPGRRLLLATAVLSLAACANLAPEYQRPPAATPLATISLATAVHDGTQKADATSQDMAALPDWQQFFTDARLKRLIVLALVNNRDVCVAALKVEQARTQLSIQDAAKLPALNASANASRSDHGGRSASAQIGLTAFELDLFGRLRNASESALQSALSSAESHRSVQLSLMAEVASAWLTLAADLQRQQLAEKTLSSRQRSHQLNVQRHQLGAINGLALAQSLSAQDQARLDAANAALQVTQDRHALDLLVGAATPPELEPPIQHPQQAEASIMLSLPANLPSQILQDRPDVRAAEHQLQGSHADIGTARAERFPRITLTGSAGSSSRDLTDLFKSGSWSFGPSVSLPIFDGGAGRAKVQAAELSRDIALAQYDKTVQTAFREVADALSVRSSLADRLAMQLALTESSALQLRLAEQNWRAGSSSQLDLLDAQRNYYAAQQALISMRLAEQSNRITLYKVLGGT